MRYSGVDHDEEDEALLDVGIEIEVHGAVLAKHLGQIASMEDLHEWGGTSRATLGKLPAKAE